MSDGAAGQQIQDPPRSFLGILKSVGPGLIISANIVGSGELIATTLLGHQVGFTLLWFIIFSCFIKVFVQVELGRYTISEGISSIEAMNRMPGPRLIVSWLVWLWILMYVGTLFQMSGMLGTIAQIFADPVEQVRAHRLWAIVAAAGVAIPLVIGRYGLIEKFSTIMVVIFTFATIAAVVSLQWTPHRFDLEDIRGGLSFGFPKDFALAFAAFGITGVGAAELIFYPIWCLEKGYARYVGPREDTPEWTARAKAWLRVMRVDAWLAMVIYTIATVAFYILGAAVLHGQPPVEEGALVARLSEMYTQSLGPKGLWVFLGGAFMVLFSTLFVSTASNARLFADGAAAFRIPVLGSALTRPIVIRMACVGIAGLLVVVYLATGKPITLVLIGAFAQATILPFLGLAAVYFCYSRTKRELRPGLIWRLFLWAALLSFIIIGAYQVVTKINSLMSPPQEETESTRKSFLDGSWKPSKSSSWASPPPSPTA